MHITTVLRVSLIGAALAAVLTAQAVSIQLSSYGTAMPVGGNTVFSETVIYNSWAGAPLTSLAYSVNNVTYAGTGAYTNGAGNTLDFSLLYSPISLNHVGSSISYTGTWVYTGGTGAYANKVGSGTLALNGLVMGPGVASTLTTFSGSLNAVPEPVPFAVLSCGLIGTLCRRRKNA